MAVDATKLRRGLRRLGEPPKDSNPELSKPVSLPEVSSDTPSVSDLSRATTTSRPALSIQKIPPADGAPQRQERLGQASAFGPTPTGDTGGRSYVDGRSRRRTGRIEQINVKVSAQFNNHLRGLADRENLLIVEVLERALDAYLRLLAVAEASGQTVEKILDSLFHAC
jgi:hypothetical protein